MTQKTPSQSVPRIHPTAVVERGAKIADDVVIGPMCFVGPKVEIGPGTRLVSHVCVLGKTSIGADNQIWPFATIGADPQDLKFRGEETSVVIGDRNQIRESVTIQLGTGNGGGVTYVGSDNLLMVGAHVAHDCHVGSHALLANNVGLSGHVMIHDHANLAGQVGVHHFCSFGSYCYVGGMSRIVHDVPPFMKAEGNPARVRALNDILLVRAGVPSESIVRLKEAHRRLFRGLVQFDSLGDLDAKTKASGDSGTMSEKLDRVSAEYPRDPYIEQLTQFMRNTLKSPTGRYLETLRKDHSKTNPTK